MIFSIERCNYVENKNVANMTSLSDTVQHFKNKLGTQTASITTLQLDNEQLKDLILDKDKELTILATAFSNVNAIVKYKTVMQIDTVRIIYQDSVPCVFKRSGAIKDNWYSFVYDSDQKGVTIDSLRAHTETTIINGFKRKWFLGRETLTTDITNSNPYLEVTRIKSAQVIVPQPWYKKWYVWLAVGVSAGLLSSQ